jgi:phenylacetate-coenzyme A ligase PaaK-like adenylate-forming protein
VITPFFPYRDCMPVLRYDTRDVARCLSEEAPGCELAGIPATSQILGKADHLLHLGGTEVITPRQLVEAIEALPDAPWWMKRRFGRERTMAEYLASADAQVRAAAPATLAPSPEPASV